MCITLVAIVLTAHTLGAQEPDSVRAARDSLEARLERAEEAIELLRQQLAAQSEAEVRTLSRVSLDLTGRALVNAFVNSGRVNSADVPQFVFPDGPDFPPAEDSPRGSTGLSARQTMLGLIVSVTDVLGGELIGDAHADFFAVQQPGAAGRVAPTVRLRTLKALVRWPTAELMVGQEVPLVAGLNPVSTASLGTPTFATAGNLWLWLPQLRATVRTRGALRLALQGAVLAPNSGDPIAGTNRDRDVDAAERSRRPFVQGRIAAQWGSEERRGELGVGVHGGWFARTVALGGRDDMHTSWATGADLFAPLGPFTLRAELYRGALLRGLGGGGIGQNFGPDGSPLLDRGGWAQLDARIGAGASLGGGCGVDDPRVSLPSTPAAASRTRNVACEAHLALRPGGPLFVGFELRRMETSWIGRPTTAVVERKFRSDHANLAVGFEF